MCCAVVLGFFRGLGVVPLAYTRHDPEACIKHLPRTVLRGPQIRVVAFFFARCAGMFPLGSGCPLSTHPHNEASRPCYFISQPSPHTRVACMVDHLHAPHRLHTASNRRFCLHGQVKCSCSTGAIPHVVCGRHMCTAAHRQHLWSCHGSATPSVVGCRI